jgi:hypothetical protein
MEIAGFSERLVNLYHTRIIIILVLQSGSSLDHPYETSPCHSVCCLDFPTVNSNFNVQRMEEGRPSGRMKRGRPKLTCAEGIRGMMGENGLQEEEWTDRNNWRRNNGEMGAGRCENIV